MSGVGPLPQYSSPVSPANGHGPSRPSTADGPGEPVYAHIDDLKEDALANFNRQQSTSQLLQRAETALGQARIHLDFRRPDLAFVEYLRACEIAVEVLPYHKDYVNFIHDQHGEQKLHLLQRKISSLDEQFGNIKEIIVCNNRRSGILPRAPKGSSQNGRGAVHKRTDSHGTVAEIEKIKPSPSPKPDRLHARAVSRANGASDGFPSSPNSEALADRFARLRGFGQGENGSRPDSRSSTWSMKTAHAPMPAVGDFGGATDLVGKELYTFKPQGPRDMPDVIAGTTRALKLAVDTGAVVAMPKPPSPTYSPARNMQTLSHIAPPRHSARSLARSSLVPSSSASATAPNGTGDYFGQSSENGVSSTGVASPKKSASLSRETCISAERLYDSLDRFNVLLIDFRSREEFDQGHIYHRNIICIEPVMVHQGMSDAELADKLILSPEEEQELFFHRDTFDLVVYYDNKTHSDSFLTRPSHESEALLRYLHEALYEFNQDKPLQRQPIVLTGGITAWADLVGNQALKSSSTQTTIKPGRPIQRRPPPRDGPVRLPKRGFREYNPLDPEEERKWRERAKSESVPATSAFVPADNEDEGATTAEDDEPLPDYPTIEDFNARFPDAGMLDQQAQLSSPSTRQPPERPAKIPQYPAAPSPSVYPPVPARPAPAAPRMSYVGVSDRAASQNTPPPRTSSQLTPYVPSKYLGSSLRLPRTGLINFGSTCYMNATLQAMSATVPVTIRFLDDQFKRQVQKENWKGSRGLLPDIYANTIRSLWKDDVSCIKPTTLFTFVGRLNSMFRDPGQQQDAQEFFSMIVDVLHEDFNAMWARTPLRALTDQEEAKRERMPKALVAKTEWGRYMHRENSFLTSLFYGQQSSRLRCPKCGNTSTQYDAWALLQIEIPDRKEARLEDCFRQHFKDELLDEDNQWTCPFCKAPRRAWKKLTMTRAPPCLVVGLKRFKTNPKTGEQRKIHTAVRFPLVGLDMEEFVLPRPSREETQEIAATYGKDALVSDDSQSPPYIYDAYAVVRHMGESTRSGHYTAAIKDRARGSWRYFNDTKVNDFQPDAQSPAQALDNDQAYLLFYQRRSPGEVTHRT